MLVVLGIDVRGDGGTELIRFSVLADVDLEDAC